MSKITTKEMLAALGMAEEETPVGHATFEAIRQRVSEYERMREALEKIARRVNGNTELPDHDTQRFYRGYNAANDECREIARAALEGR